MKRLYRFLPLLVVAAAALAAVSCLPGDGKVDAASPAGFFWGVWHGWVAPVSLIVGLFNHAIRVYEPINSGWWYDLGFYAALVGGFGGFALFRSARRRRR
jgi:hypothetical protein